MKSLFRFLVVAVLVLGVAAFFVRDSAYWTALEIQRGLDDHDVARVERVVALERFSASATVTMGAVVADQLGVAGDDPGSKLLGAVVGAIASGVGDATAKDAAKEMRKAIKDGRLERRIGPFVVAEGAAALGAVSSTIDGATLELKGTCDGPGGRDGAGNDATLLLVMERHDDGLLGGRPRRYVVVGVDPESGKRLARQCAVSGASARSPSSSSSSSSSSSKRR